MKFNHLLIFCFYSLTTFSQAYIQGIVRTENLALSSMQILINKKQITTTDSIGYFKTSVLKQGKYEIEIIEKNFQKFKKEVNIEDGIPILLNIELIAIKEKQHNIEEVVVTGTLKPVSRLDSAVPVEVFKSSFFKKNPVSNIFEGLQNINGIRPQLNCNICNTGDIHINGLEGPYTFVLIDGMPIVSGLSTVYGLSGIPNSLVERIEIIEGPASSLYGSEAVGGLINIITKNPKNVPIVSLDGFSTSWGEANLDFGFKFDLKKISVLTGINYFNYSNPIDNNKDHFTDVTLQDRISIFQKWNFERNSKKLLSLAGRYSYEDRWGGEMQWNKSFRGSDQVYGESIYTKRYEILGVYELPIKEKMKINFSYTNHNQNSAYGKTLYLAQQNIGFGQLTWDKVIKKHYLLFGLATRYQFYDDNTPATFSENTNWISSIFLQNDIKLNDHHTILLGTRYDFNKNHENIFTPRFAYKWKPNNNTVARINAGTGFRVVNLFTEEHAALTGAREIIITEKLKPEQSYNANLNVLRKWYLKNGSFISWENSIWYTYFTNTILPDYETNTNAIIYKNLDGFAESKGISSNLDLILGSGLKVSLGATFMDVSKTAKGIQQRQLLTERFSGTWSISYAIPKWFLSFDYTGNIYGPMKLPLLSDTDPRKPNSSTYSIQNIQCTINKIKNLEIYLGIKNLLNWTPNKGNPFIIARSHDPFDKNIQYDINGNVMATPENPYSLTFDPTYVYGPNQGIRSFIGIRYFMN
ncbi:TonB-dependent receptor [Flavobacterium covae]|uniref:TonB-dependent receptor n=1 Tax=Flavobacterium covae TaxID=2906076 RepID=UPI000B4CB0AA|nr:TonB-dependent receptor [Flavobacterium covae]OWP87240.1 TonB-dependent receptor [Flavobacterium covae]